MEELGEIVSNINNLDFVVDAWLDPETEDNVFTIKVEVEKGLAAQLWKDWFNEY